MKYAVLFVLLLPLVCLRSQAIFPALSGQELLDSLAARFRPPLVYDYDRARDTLFAKIESRNDTLVCVYTGYPIVLNPSLDPTVDAFSKGINTEHTWPRAFGAASGNPEGDMHHLFPTREGVNNDRGNLPFGNVPDNQATRWYFRNQQSSNPPPLADRPAWSKLRTNQRFETRLAHKGNLARAMFYFYTVYRPEVDAATPDFFPPQIAELCQWHLLDPVDQRERDRSAAIALRQSGKENPFVLDCNLLQRTYCPELPPQNCLSAVEEATPMAQTAFYFRGVGQEEGGRFLAFELEESARELTLECFDALGRRLPARPVPTELAAGQYRLAIGPANQPQQPLLVRLRLRLSSGAWVVHSVVVP